MALRQKFWDHLWGELDGCLMHSRFYSSKVNFKSLRPMILKRIQDRAKDYPVQSLAPVAHDIIKARELLIHGVSALLKVIPVMTCKYCPEIYVGKEGHLIQTCHGYKRRTKKQAHRWINATLNDILVPVETFHLHKMFQGVIKHDQRFDFERVPAILELCCQAGVNFYDENLSSSFRSEDAGLGSSEPVEPLSPHDLRFIGDKTLKAWETLRSGVKRLMLVYPVKVCKDCSEVHVGPSGHKARLCGVFKYESWKGAHFWKRAELDDIVPPKIVWRRRLQDPPVLLDNGRNFYGHAPAVVEMCLQAGAIAPKKYFCMMKVEGLPPPI